MDDILTSVNFDCTCGKTHGISTKVIYEKNAIERVSYHLQSVFMQGNAAVVASVNLTDTADLVEKNLYRNGYTVRGLRIDERNLTVKEGASLVKKLPECVRFLIGVGSGTMADIVRLAAHDMDVGYALIVTAPSADSYLSARVKDYSSGETIYARYPEMLIIDEDVIENSPSFLTAAGYGRVVAQIVNIFDTEFNKFTRARNFCDTVFNALAKEIHKFELDKEKPGFKKRLMEVLLKISRANEYLGVSDTATDVFAAVLTRVQNERTEGENSLLAGYIVLNLYKSYLNTAAVDTILPPDIIKTIKLLEKSNVIDYNKYVRQLEPSTVDDYLKQSFILGEYRQDLFELICDIDLCAITRFWRRLYVDAGYWLKSYMTAAQLKRYLSLAAELSRNTLLKHIKRVGYLEYSI